MPRQDVCLFVYPRQQNSIALLRVKAAVLQLYAVLYYAQMICRVRLISRITLSFSVVINHISRDEQCSCSCDTCRDVSGLIELRLTAGVQDMMSDPPRSGDLQSANFRTPHQDHSVLESCTRFCSLTEQVLQRGHR